MRLPPYGKKAVPVYRASAMNKTCLSKTVSFHRVNIIINIAVNTYTAVTHRRFTINITVQNGNVSKSLKLLLSKTQN